MKVIYIGKCNSFAANLVDRLVKQDHDIYIISEKKFTNDIKPSLSYKWYQCKNDCAMQKVFASVKPDVVIFAGEVYMQEVWDHDENTNRYLTKILNVLILSVLNHVQKIVYLSSAQVYGCDMYNKLEEDKTEPATYKGLLCSQGEHMVTEYKRISSMDAVILRIGDMYGFDLKEKERDFVSNLAEHLYTEKQYQANKNKYYYPVHRKDCVDAVVRALDITPSTIYNVGSSEKITEEKAVKMLNDILGKSTGIKSYEGDLQSYPLDGSRIKRELEWVCFFNFDTALKTIDYTKDAIIQKKKTITQTEKGILAYIENFGVFMAFAFASILIKDHAVLSQIDLMYLYIMIISLFLGIRHSIVSVILASMFYMLLKGISIANFSSILINVEFMLHLAQYLFVGATIGYTVDYYHTLAREKSEDLNHLQKEFNELKEINDDNTMIKLEYERRLISSRNSLPKLYSVISQLAVLEPEKIFMEAVKVVEDIMETDSVAVYLSNHKSTYLHLIAGSGSKETFLSKTINLEQAPAMREKLLKGELYTGNHWEENEPVFAAPIMQEDKLIAVISIYKLKFSSINLYNMNLFRTLTLLITSSIIRAKKYEDVSRHLKYIPDTEILTVKEFEKLLLNKREEKKKRISEYSVIQILIKSTMLETYYNSADLFRNTDYFGTNDRKDLFVLLGNTSSENVYIVIDRLKEKGLEAVIVDQ